LAESGSGEKKLMEGTETVLVVVNPSGIIGAALFVRTKQPDAVLLVASAAAFAAVYTLTHGDIGDRYRLPIDPLLILFAVDSLATFWPRRRAAQRA